MAAFTKNTVSNINEDIVNALKEIEAKHGIKISHGGSRYSTDNITLKLEISKIDSNGQAKTRYMVSLENFYPEKVNKIIMVKGLGMKAKIVGYNNRAPKYPFIVLAENGKQYKMSPAQIEV